MSATLLMFSHSQHTKFCSTLLVNSTEKKLRMSREINILDFGHNYELKKLHCCFAYYESIEWYKGNTRLLNGGTYYVTTFDHAEDGNQSLVSDRLQDMDEGNYTCIAQNGSDVMKHTINLTVTDRSEHTGPPIPMMELKDLYAWPGENRRFYCSAFIGYGNMTPGVSKVVWLTSDGNKSSVPDNIANTTYLEKTKDDILGAILSFEPVTKEAFGTYTCKMSNGIGKPRLFNVTLHEGDDPNTRIRTTYKETLIALAVFTSLCILTATLVSRWHLELQLLWKDRLGKLEEGDDRLYDVFVCYDQDDAEFALGTLVPILEEHCKYRCFAWERDSLAGEWIPETYSQGVRQSRRFLMVLSPALANNTWCIYALYVAIDAMLNLHSRIICVLLEDVDWDAVKLCNGQPDESTLRQVTRVVRLVKWDPQPKRLRTFWNRLRLYLPPRRTVPLRFEICHAPSQEPLMDVAN